MKLAGRKIPTVFSLAIWALLWELAGRAELSTIVPRCRASSWRR